MTVIQHFLLIFDHNRAELIEQCDFGNNAQGALEAYSAAELKHRDDDNIEIVLIGSDSIETVKLTHANYFDGTVAVSKYLAGI